MVKKWPGPRGLGVFVAWATALEGEATALDLVAVGSGVELLEVLLVLAGDEGIGKPGSLSDANISGEATDLAGDPLHAAFALKNGVVDIVDTLNQVVHWVNLFGDITLPSDGGQRHIGWEEEGEADNNEDSNNDEGDIREEAGLLLLVGNLTVASGGSTIGRSGLFVAGSRGAIGGSRGTIRGSRGAVASSWGTVARGWGRVSTGGCWGGGSVGMGMIVTTGSVALGDFLLQFSSLRE